MVRSKTTTHFATGGHVDNPHKNDPVADDPLFDPTSAGAYLGGVALPTLARWRQLGTGPNWVKLGSLVKYRRSALDRYIEECTRRSHRRVRRSTETAA